MNSASYKLGRLAPFVALGFFVAGLIAGAVGLVYYVGGGVP